jgi:hypothetical protein
MANIIAFYVDGTVLDSVLHNSPWLTSQDAQDACWAYCQELNVWWDLMYPSELYMDETFVIVDDIHPGAVRAGCVPDSNDSPPLPSFEGYEVVELDWQDWLYFPSLVSNPNS